ncbi:hypothetical protein [Aerolutibacter ruishenii]|uniref:hypothetical protein n=1 Tax=Aerolutibacter ruishenii TaxID=686800 RepID=UPI0011A6D3AF|nr:hypothetical protein [Lysobacter ruishenii]
MRRSIPFKPALLATTCLLALPAASQTGKGPRPQVWMDVATHSMAGMPEMDGLAGAAMGMLGGQGMGNHYGAARHGAMPGRHVDISLWNGAAPGKEAEQRIPAGLRLGERLPLLPPKATPPSASTQPEGKPQDHQQRILVYWGCGAEVRAGQPRVITISSKNGQVQVSGSLQGRYAPDRSPDIGPTYALWPNDRDHRSIPQGASLVGQHQIVGPQVPESLRFDLQQAQDFMPAIALSSTGSFAAGFNLGWQPVARARGYFLHAMGTRATRWCCGAAPRPPTPAWACSTTCPRRPWTNGSARRCCWLPTARRARCPRAYSVKAAMPVPCCG